MWLHLYFPFCFCFYQNVDVINVIAIKISISDFFSKCWLSIVLSIKMASLAVFSIKVSTFYISLHNQISIVVFSIIILTFYSFSIRISITFFFDQNKISLFFCIKICRLLLLFYQKIVSLRLLLSYFRADIDFLFLFYQKIHTFFFDQNKISMLFSIKICRLLLLFYQKIVFLRFFLSNFRADITLRLFICIGSRKLEI